MLTFRVHGNKNQGVGSITKGLGRACFLSGYHIVDFTQCGGHAVTGVVKFDKVPVLSLDATLPDLVVIADAEDAAKNLKYVKNGSIVLFNSKQKVNLFSLKKHKTKNYIINADELSENAHFVPILLGSVTKIFDKISVKNMKKAMDVEATGSEGFEEGYKSVKQMR